MYPWLTNVSLYVANACKKQRFTVNTVQYKLAESYIMPGTN